MYISQCLIVKNEEENIEHCLGHLKSVVDEQIVVDTGSTDKTVELAEKMGAKVFHFEWINDFSAARNFSIDKAKGDWIIFLDCDEYFSEDSVPNLKRQMKIFDKDKNIDGIMCKMINIDKSNNLIAVVNNISPRIFKNKKKLRYKNKIHEGLYNSCIRRGTVTVGDAGNALVIYHTGYDKGIVNEKNKIERNISMLEASILESPEDAKLHYYLSNEYFRVGKHQEAVKSAQESLVYKNEDVREFYYPLIYRNILRSMDAMSSALSEMKQVFNEAIREYLEYPDYYYIMGLAALRENNHTDASIYLEKCIKLCDNYKMNVESNSVANIEIVYTALVQANILTENKPKIVELCIAILNVNKYNYPILRVLINTFLTVEKEESIFEFFRRIYDYNSLKDKLYLLKASKQNNNEKLMEMYKGLMSIEELKAIENKEK